MSTPDPTDASAPLDRKRLRSVAGLVAAACLVPAVLDTWQAWMQARVDPQMARPWPFVVFQGGEWIILGALTPVAYVLGARFPLRRPHLLRDVLVHVGGALVVCVGWAACGIGLRALLGILPPDISLPRHAASWVLTSLPWSVFLYFTMLGSMLAGTYFFEARAREAQAARLAAQVTQARLDALRMQLRPHFLFNSLNAVAVLVRDGRAADATRVVEELSDILREVLAAGDAATVPLSREIGFLEKYLSIERTRFSDRLEVAWAVAPDARDVPVPSFVMQPLVENALRHGVAARPAPTRVVVRAAVEGGTLVLSVSNDAPDPAPADARGGGVGLANTRERLAALYGRDASLTLEEEEGRVTATVRLPAGVAP